MTHLCSCWYHFAELIQNIKLYSIAAGSLQGPRIRPVIVFRFFFCFQFHFLFSIKVLKSLFLCYSFLSEAQTDVTNPDSADKTSVDTGEKKSLMPHFLVNQTLRKISVSFLTPCQMLPFWHYKMPGKNFHTGVEWRLVFF